MPQLDEVSSKLGGIEATQNHILKSVHAIETMFKDVGDKVVLHGASIDAAHKRLDKLEPIVDGHESKMDESKGGVKVMVWAASGISFIVTALINIAAVIFK